jgi:hypothetical protein
MSLYDGPSEEQAKLLDAALDAEKLRFDGGDLMPPDVGGEPFFDAMVRYMSRGSQSLDGVLADLEAAWPDDG